VPKLAIISVSVCEKTKGVELNTIITFQFCAYGKIINILETKEKQRHAGKMAKAEKEALQE